MKKIIKLTESDLIRIVKRVINEGSDEFVKGTRGIEKDIFSRVLKKYIEIEPKMKIIIDPIIISNEVKWKDRKTIRDAFTKVEDWCDSNSDDICGKILDYTAGDRSTIENLIP